MTTFACLNSTPGPTLSVRRSVVLAACVAALSLVVLALPPPAGAVVTTVGVKQVGLQPRDGTSITFGRGTEALGVVTLNPAETFANNSGNPVIHTSSTYVVYWDPTNHYHGDWQHVIDGFMQNVGTASGSLDNVFAVDGQYSDKSNVPAARSTTFRGAYTDTHAYPTAELCKDPHALLPGDAITCLTDAQLQSELTGFIASNHLQTGTSAIYYLLTPPGVTVCLDAAGEHCSDYSRSKEEEEGNEFKSASYERSFCSYHSAINPGKAPGGEPATVLYAAIPWVAGGKGDLHLAAADRTAATDCQDGGYDPSTKPNAEEREKRAPKSAKEISEREAKPEKERNAQLEAEELEGPHAQEPNQLACPTADGGCDTGLADLIIGQIGAEQQNTVTDPLLNAWKDSQSKELTDECRNFFALTRGGSAGAVPFAAAGTLFNQALASGNYYLNDAFNRASTLLPYPGVPCQNNIALVPQFTAPNPVNAGDVVGFDGMESNITLDASTRFDAAGAPQPNYATYSWNFGDGSPPALGYAPGAPACETPWLSPCAASEFHSYTYGGTYSVTLTVTDVGGNTASTTQPVTVVGGSPPPSPAPTPPASNPVAGSTPATTTSTTATTTTTSTPPPPANPNPVAAAAGASRSLKTVLRKGLVVRYSVNEQVAGHFDVLLAKSLANKLGIGGAPAFGLPAGTPAQLVVAKAILVTTKGGRSTVDIQFSKRTAARLKHLHKVSLLLRLTVHNSGAHPGSTTVLSTIVLSN